MPGWKGNPARMKELREALSDLAGLESAISCIP
jgi:hypothetical protein